MPSLQPVYAHRGKQHLHFSSQIILFQCASIFYVKKIQKNDDVVCSFKLRSHSAKESHLCSASLYQASFRHLRRHGCPQLLRRSWGLIAMNPYKWPQTGWCDMEAIIKGFSLEIRAQPQLHLSPETLGTGHPCPFLVDAQAGA